MAHVWYFAYGSNMDVTRLIDKRLRPEGVITGERVLGRLDGWRLCFNKPWAKFAEGGAANILPDRDHVVYGTLNLMEERGLTVLDRYEGVAGGHYQRETLDVLRPDTGETVKAVAYIALRDLSDRLLPPRFYLDHLLAGRDLLPPDYMAWLEQFETLPILSEL
jgi:gamma-glutamylcyclotransferase